MDGVIVGHISSPIVLFGALKPQMSLVGRLTMSADYEELEGAISIRDGVLVGHISSAVVLSGALNPYMSLIGRLAMPTGYEHYNGDYEVTPKIDAQIMATKDKVMANDVTVKAIPYYEVSNQLCGSRRRRNGMDHCGLVNVHEFQSWKNLSLDANGES